MKNRERRRVRSSGCIEEARVRRDAPTFSRRIRRIMNLNASFPWHRRGRESTWISKAISMISLPWPRLHLVPRGASKAARLRSREIRKQRRCEVDREIRKRAAAESIGSRWLCDDWPKLTFIIKVVIGSPVIKLPPWEDFIKGLII